MADEEVVAPVAAAEETPAGPVEVAPPKEMDVMEALKAVLRKALSRDGLKRGLHECAKALDRRTARLCILAVNCTEDHYKNLVKALCESNSIPMLEVPDNKDLGIWCGLCKLDAEGNPRKVVGCSCACIVDYGEDTHELQVLLNHLKKQG
eukprot:CAMPEP_0185572500 /NCGR_PEP_ID=MMETSP0434-20130131/4417_1 /TAXON_ID=626734 ORGANISM="Favella taraikaensis, Strain Fe Narragansett Bay" /NCGR_SAMPLE_ID=MMETSP0434 /ASSEMBLY_ACC=CAM_ASM_000379 /LENGTH=149 /DNA_ID=CAMNT_0028188391 /DNA_START=22 /DNA_END=471 /DNA_ORIENTATION=-